MAQLQSTDKFIVDRGGSTYKTTFEDIQQSLDLAYTYTGKVDDVAGGTIVSDELVSGGGIFFSGRSYELRSAFNNGNTITITVNSVVGDGLNGEVETYTITENTSGIVNNEIFEILPYDTIGQIKGITNGAGADTGIPDGESRDYPIIQASYDFEYLDDDGITLIKVPNPDYDGDAGQDNDSQGRPEHQQVYPSGGTARVTGAGGSSGEPTIEIVNFGSNYKDGEAYLERFNQGVLDDSYKVNLETVTDSDLSDDKNLLQIRITEVADGGDLDKILLTVQIGSDETTAQTVAIKPGYGINFRNALDETGTPVENEVEILSTLIPGGGGGGGGGTSSALVIINPTPPEEPTYEINSGTLWYNTTNGRLYVAIYYPAATAPAGFSFDWVDASPSGLNDVVKRGGDTMHGSLFMEDDQSISTTIYDLERLPLISSI